MGRPSKNAVANFAPSRQIDAAPIAKVVAATVPPAFEPVHEPVDALDAHMGIVRYLDLPFTLGSATVLISEANMQVGSARKVSLLRAIRLLNNEVEHLTRSGAA